MRRLNDKDGLLTLLRDSSSILLRLALGASFLSAVADRFGLWGAFGEPYVAWGSFARFVGYTGQLNWFLPKATIPTLAIAATCAEAILGIMLLLGWQTRIAALASGIVLVIFGVTMAAALGVKAPLNFSVFSAMGGAFLLASCAEYPFSIDHLRHADLQSSPVPQRHDHTMAGTPGAY